MSWGFVAGAAISVVGGVVAGSRSTRVADTARDAQMDATAAQERIAEQQMAMQQEQFDYFKGRQVGVDATAEEVTRRQLAMAEETQAQGRDLYNYQKDVFRPAEQSLVSQAMRESTPEYYEQFAQKAMASQAAAHAGAQDQTERTLASMGVNPNSGAYQSRMRGLTLGNAASMGAVANDSRDRAEALGWARKAEAVGLGKGLVGAGNASYGLAADANNSATAATNGANNTAAGALGTPTQYGQMGITARNGAIGGYGDIYRTVSNSASADAAATGAAFNSFGQMAAQYFNRPPTPGV